MQALGARGSAVLECMCIVFIHMYMQAALKLHACFLGKALDTGPRQLRAWQLCFASAELSSELMRKHGILNKLPSSSMHHAVYQSRSDN